MKLNNNSILEKDIWENKGFKLPTFNRDEVINNTLEEPTWLHFGAGNLFRAFTATVQNKLLNEGKANKGIIVAEGFDYDLIDSVYTPFDNLSLLVTLMADGKIEKEIIGSVVKSIIADSTKDKEWSELKRIFRAKSLQMVSFTITEKGYAVKDSAGNALKYIATDIEKGIKGTNVLMGKIAALCYERFTNGATPISLVSMDNCSHNGTKLYEGVSFYVEKWVEMGIVDKEFLNYINDETKVAFPWSMIDKITPRPDAFVKESLEKDGFEDNEIIVTNKNSYSASFVNAEGPQYLVIQDAFPNGRPNIDEGGVIFTDRETVNKVEKMKVCTCLNPLHTTLAIYGCLFGHTSIANEMKDKILKTLVEKIAYDEAIKVVTDPGILNPLDFIKEVLEIRFPNPFLPDTPQRIATDTSQKIAIRFGETIKAYNLDEKLDVMDLKLIPLAIAGWCRYLMGIDDSGHKFTLSSDPLLDTLTDHINGIELGFKGDVSKYLKPILSDINLMGSDLYKLGLGERIEGYFKEMIVEKGSIKTTLKKYLAL